MLPSTVRILLCTTHQDMRKSIDSLAAVVRESLNEDATCGTLYVFLGKRPTRVKVLWWDRNGFCLLQKRLHRALFVIPEGTKNGAAIQIDGAGLHRLLSGIKREEKAKRRLASVH